MELNTKVEAEDSSAVPAASTTEEQDAEVDASENENISAHPKSNLNSECLDDPNFATICSFLENFGELVRLDEQPFDELQTMLENTTEVPDALVKLHLSLLRRVFKSITPDKWEKSLAKFGHTYCNQDGWEIERFGYKKAKLQTKLRILKNLLEAQFDFNVKFKAEVNKLQAGDLRLIPLGRDCEGQVYWYQLDNDANLRVYREDIDDETWEIVASNREEFCELIAKLEKGDVKKPREAIILDEDSNEKEIETKEIILDTGKPEENDQDEESEESEDDGEEEDSDEEDEESLGIIAPSKEKDRSKLHFATKSLPPVTPVSLKQDISIQKKDEDDHNSSDMDVDDHSDEMEIDESPPKPTEPVPVKIDNSKTPLKAETLKASAKSFIAKPKHDIDEEKSLNLKVPVKEKAVVKEEVKVLKSEKESYQDDKRGMHVITKPLLISPTDNKLPNTNKVDLVKSISAKSKPNVDPLNKPCLLAESSKESQLTEDSQSVNRTKSDDNIITKTTEESVLAKKEVEETITKSEAWICGKGDDPSSKKSIMQDKPEFNAIVLKGKAQQDLELKSNESMAKANEIKINPVSEPVPAVQEYKKSCLETQILEVESQSQESLLSLKTEPIAVTKENVDNQALKENKASIPLQRGKDFSDASVVPKSSTIDAEPVLLDTVKLSAAGELNARKGESSEQTIQELNSHSVDFPKLESHFIENKEISHQMNVGIAKETVEIPQAEDVTEKPKLNETIEFSPETTEKPNVAETLKTIKQGEETSKTPKPEAGWIKNSKADSAVAVELLKPEEAVKIPKVEQAIEIPNAEAVKMPKVEQAIEVPKAEEAVKIPKVEQSVEVPKAATIHKAEPAVEAPKTEEAAIVPKVEKVIKIPKAEEIRIPKVEEAMGVPKTEEAIEVPKAEQAIEVPQAVEVHKLKESVQTPKPEKAVHLSKPKEATIQIPKADETIKIHKLEESNPMAVKDTDAMIGNKETPKEELMHHQESKNVSIENVRVDETSKNLNSNGSQEHVSKPVGSSEPPQIQLVKEKLHLEPEPEVKTDILNQFIPPHVEPVKKRDVDEHIQNIHIAADSEGSLDTRTENSKLNPVSQSSIDTVSTSSKSLTETPMDTDKSNKLNSPFGLTLPKHEISSTPAKGAEVNSQLPLQNKTVEIEEESVPKASLLGLVSYDSSSDDESMEGSVKAIKKEINPADVSKSSDNVPKRKLEDPIDPTSIPSKISKHDHDNPSSENFNPIVGEAVEEEMIFITGEGSGAQNDGGNDELELENNHNDVRNGKEAGKNSEKTGGKVDDSSDSESANEDSQESLEIQTPRSRGRGRPSKNKRPGPKSSKSSSGGERKPRGTPGRPRGGRSEVAKLGVSLDSLEVNGSGDGNDKPVRASRRIAQIRQKEEEERRQLEEERLAQLKAAQLRKKQKQAEAAKLRVGKEGEEGKVMKPKPSKATKLKPVQYESGSSSETNSSGDEGEEYQNEDAAKPKGKKIKKWSKTFRHKAGNPWATSSDEDSEAVEEEEEYHYEEEEEQLVFNESDHEFSPESDLGEDDDAGPSRHARTAKKGKGGVDKEEETGCRKCGKGDHPEWILLCDKCDHGWHASCLRPQLWVIPEGEWFCPPCQHNLLISQMTKNLIEFDKLFKRRENDILRKQRLAFVGISLNNVLPSPEKEEKKEGRKSSDERGRRDKKSRRRIILSDEEISDNFIDDNSDGRGSDRSSDEDSGGPIYRLRARRGAKSFDYKAYDDMINSAIRESDEEIEAAAEVEEAEEEGAVAELNGDEEKEPVEVEHGGKNEAFEKHLQEQDETDEELLGEKERLKRREKKKAAQKKKRRSLRDLDDYTDDEDNSDEDFKGSDAQEDDENDEDAVEDDESEWSGDKDDSDDSIAARSRNRGKKGKYGRREQYLEVGTVRRSTRRRKAKVTYDETDEEGEEEGGDKWNSEESDAEETPSESDDETYGKRKKQKKVPARSAVPRFFLGGIGAGSKSPSKKPAPSKKKKRKVDEDDVDRAWSSSQGSKAKKKAAEETVERRTRGRKINFKDILDSGESDDDGNIIPKRRRIESDDEDDEASTSRRLAEEIKAANQKEAAMYAAKQKQGKKSDSVPASAPSSIEDETESKDSKDEKSELSKPSHIPHSSPTPLVLTKQDEVSRNTDKPPSLELEMALAKPVPAPPIPPALAKALGRNKSKSPAGSGEKSPSKSQPNHGGPNIPVSSIPITASLSGLPPSPGSKISSVAEHPHNISSMDLSAAGIPPNSATPPNSTTSKSSSSKKGRSTPNPSGSSPTKPSLTPPMTLSSPMRPMGSPLQQAHGLMSQGLPPGLPMDIGRVPNPTLFQGNPAMRPYHPMWVRNPGPPPYGGGGVPPQSIGKPPPLNSTAFMSQHGQPRPGYPSPPPLRIPNPNTSPLQAFQHFKSDSPHSQAMYRMPPGQTPPGGLPGLLARGMVPHQGPPERFFGPSPFSPYNILPPHTQSQPPQSLFSASQYDFRPGEPFKDERRGTPPGPSSPPPQTTNASSTGSTKEEPSQQESEFGGLVSYFSSQRSEEDMDN